MLCMVEVEKKGGKVVIRFCSLAIFFWIMLDTGTSRPHPNTVYHVLLFSFELCLSLWSSATLSSSLHSSNLLFSFELCSRHASQPCYWLYVCPCYFLLNYAKRCFWKGCTWQVRCKLAIFFWIMPDDQPIFRVEGCDLNMFLLFSFELCEPGRESLPLHNMDTQIRLAIFFWIMLDSLEELLRRHPRLENLLFSFELCLPRLLSWF